MPQTVVRTLTLSLDTSAYASGDLLADTQELADAVKMNDAGGIIQSIVAIDADDQTASAYDVYILDSNVSMGTENSAPSITDANAAYILGKIAIATGDWNDLGGCKVASLRGLNLPIKPASGSTSVYVAVVNGAGTPTFTASGVKLRFGICQG